MLCCLQSSKWRLLGEDWSHLFPPAKANTSPKDSLKKFQGELEAMAQRCDQFNATANSRMFPHCFPMYVNNPRVLETSVSV